MILVLFILYLTSLSSAANDNITDSSGHDQSTEDVAQTAISCTPENYPFIVTIMELKFPPEKQSCAGTLLDAYHVLTAASCLDSKHTLMVVAGINDLQDLPQIRFVRDRIPHLLHSSSEFKNDMAVLVLEDPIYQSDHIGYVVLPTKPYENSEIEKLCETGLSLSWGHTVYEGQVSELPDVTSLQCTPLSIVPPQDCKSRMNINEANVCTSSVECQGDQGGPILCNGQQFAVISWKTGCSKHRLSVHTRADKNLDFIRLFVKPTIQTRSINMGVSKFPISITKWFILVAFLFK